MPRFKTERIVVKDRENRDEFLDFKCVINIDAHGFFYTYFPSEIQELFKAAGEIPGLQIGKDKTNFMVEGKDFETVLSQVKIICQDYLSKELVDKRFIIKYQIETGCSYCKCKNGELVPNGYYQQKIDGGDEYDWQKDTRNSHATNPVPYGFEVFVQPVVCETYRYKSGKQWVKERKMRDHETECELLKWLCSLCGMTPPKTFGGGAGMKEIEYTPEVAMFFVTLIKGIFALNEKIKDMIEPEAIKKLANSQLQLMG